MIDNTAFKTFLESPGGALPLEQTEGEVRLLKRLHDRRFDLDRPPPAPEPRFYIGNIGICTPGNLTAVSASVKSGKSSWVGAMIAAVVTRRAEDADCLGIRAANPHAHAVLHFDTEQSPYDHFDLIRRALKRASADTAPPWLHSFCVTGFQPPEIRRAIPLVLDEAAERHGGLHSVMIDGIVDLVANPNDPEESNALVSELQELAIQWACPFIGLIHFNPGSDKTRGHLGSQLERKAETNLRLDKDAGGITTVWSDKNRRAPILRDQGPRFQWSEEAGMHVSLPSEGKVRVNKRQQELRDLAEAILAAVERPCLAWREWVEAIADTTKKAPSTAEKRFDQMRALGVVRKTAFAQWELA